MTLKYIITEHKNFALFSEGLESHSVIASRVFGKVVGAGFARISTAEHDHNEYHTKINVECYGKSISLGIDSRKEDGEIINRQLNNEDY